MSSATERREDKSEQSDNIYKKKKIGASRYSEVEITFCHLSDNYYYQSVDLSKQSLAFQAMPYYCFKTLQNSNVSLFEDRRKIKFVYAT